MPRFDTLIRCATIIDGTGKPGFKADIGLENGRITRIGNLKDLEASETISGSELVASPGFIDIHSHADLGILWSPRAESLVMQGVTTAVTGNCGLSLAPVLPKNLASLEEYLAPREPLSWEWRTFGEFNRKLQESGTAVNLVPLVGHGTIRACVMGFDDRRPTTEELTHMGNLLESAMKDGAFGMSTGLIYPPGVYSETPELIALAEIVAQFGGTYTSHIRGESEILIGLINAVKEAIEIGEQANVPVQISHHKASGKAHWGKVRETLDLMEQARGRGVDVSCDVYPYTAGSASLMSALPPWVLDQGVAGMIDRITNSDTRARIERELRENGTPGWGAMEDILISRCVSDARIEGMTIGQIAASREVDPPCALLALLAEDHAKTSMITFTMSEDDVISVLTDPFSMVCSDSGVCNPESGGKPHPRTYGAFPRVLGHYVRDRACLTLEEAIRKMTWLPAQRMGLTDRGILREGARADVVLFDPSTIRDTATYVDPHRYPEGIVHVLVSGQAVVRDGTHTGTLPGEILSRPGTERKPQ